MNKFRTAAACYFVLSVLALVTPDCELLFCTFIVCTNVWAVGYQLSTKESPTQQEVKRWADLQPPFPQLAVK